MTTEEKMKHLEFIQGVINRMANNSFLLKGWTITIVAALFALFAKDTNPNYILIAFLPVIIFWLLDSYYLAQERRFRTLYNAVIMPNSIISSFSMDTKVVKNSKNTWFKAIFSRTLNLFYLPFVLVLAVIVVLLRFGFTLFPI